MSETRRVRSISRKIGNSWALHTALMLFWLDIAILILGSAALIYAFEKSILGSSWQPHLDRSILWNRPQTLLNAEYCLTVDGQQHTFALYTLLKILFPYGATLLVIEIIMLISRTVHAHRKARALLQPLDKMARDMQTVIRRHAEQPRYEDRIHDLENAIGQISPTRPDEKLRTGAQELTGLENAINGLLVRMHESYRQQAQFVSDASHELRTPIAVIQGYAHMLARWGKDDPQVLEESISAIQSESDYMKKLVEELLFLARGEIGRNPFDPKPLSLTALLKDVCEESAMIDAAHEWVFKPSAEVQTVADAEMLKQCARVLCENARKYTPEGGQILISVSEDEEWARFRVQDEGIGISADDVPHIFDRFYRSDPARGRNSGGSGLGLSIAQWIVERHNGYFDVLSREEIGTRFTVSLPKDRKTEETGA